MSQAAIGQLKISTDFTPGNDEIELLAIDAKSNASGNQASPSAARTPSRARTASSTASSTTLARQTDSPIIFADVNGDGGSANDGR